MTIQKTAIADRFLAGKDCTCQELNDLKKWLSSSATREEVENWMLEHWIKAPEIGTRADLQTIFEQIQNKKKGHSRSIVFSLPGLLKVYQKVAAFLLIPIIGLGLLIWISQYGQTSGQFTETIVPRGQKSQIVLADGTRVWLNSGTKIRYPTAYNKKQRDVYLEGEAFFEVTQDGLKPFVVHTPGLEVKVLGTKFNVKAYLDEDQVETSLFEGKVNLITHDPKSSKTFEQEMASGQSFVYLKKGGQLMANRFAKEEINGWKNNQLLFRDDTFNNLVRKVERWYDVEVDYDETLFSDRRLTVELYKDESLERLMKIISLTLEVDYHHENGKIMIMPK